MRNRKIGSLKFDAKIKKGENHIVLFIVFNLSLSKHQHLTFKKSSIFLLFTICISKIPVICTTNF